MNKDIWFHETYILEKRHMLMGVYTYDIQWHLKFNKYSVIDAFFQIKKKKLLNCSTGSKFKRWGLKTKQRLGFPSTKLFMQTYS